MTKRSSPPPSFLPPPSSEEREAIAEEREAIAEEREAIAEELAALGEAPLSGDEHLAALHLADFLDAATRSVAREGAGARTDPQEIGPPDPSEEVRSPVAEALPNEWREVASMGLLLRHVTNPPALDANTRCRLEEELLERVPEPAASEAWSRGWRRWLSLLEVWLPRPALAAFALVLIAVGSWGVFQTLETPSSRRASVAHVTSQPFYGEFSRPRAGNPFAQSRTSSERLGRVTEKLGAWQRDRWIERLRSQRYNNL